MKTAVLLVQIGSPKTPAVDEVRKYQRNFLSDPLVISPQPPFWKHILKWFILPHRSPKTAKHYEAMLKSSESGEMPMLYNTRKLAEKTNSAHCFLYAGDPNPQSAIRELAEQGYEKIVIFPLHPQRSSATTEAALQYFKSPLETSKNSLESQFRNNGVFRYGGEPAKNKHSNSSPMPLREPLPTTYEVNRGSPLSFSDLNDKSDTAFFGYSCRGTSMTSYSLAIPKLILFDKGFAGEDFYINALVESIKKTYNQAAVKPTDIVFSFHGIPKKCIANGDPYFQDCETTVRLIFAKLPFRLKYHLSFQSKFNINGKWLEPSVREVVCKLAKKNAAIMVVCPGFVSDNLETIIEIDDELRAYFEREGGQFWSRVPCLNTDEVWVSGLKNYLSVNFE